MFCSIFQKKKNYLAQITFSCQAPLGPGRRKGDRLAGRLQKIASTAERHGGGWCRTVRCALPCSVLCNRDKMGKVECIEVMH